MALMRPFHKNFQLKLRNVHEKYGCFVAAAAKMLGHKLLTSDKTHQLLSIATQYSRKPNLKKQNEMK